MQTATRPKLDILVPTIVQNYTSSASFMKQLTAIAISTLVHFKTNFPKENNFNEETFGGTKVWMLRRHCESRIAQFITNSIINAFEAIDKKYLQQLTLCFYEDGNTLDTLLEYYIFEFKYNDPGISIGIKNKETNLTENLTEISFEDVVKCTNNLICACNMMAHSFPALPDDYTITIRLFYNNDAPEGYNPNGFSPARAEDGDILSVLDGKIPLGQVRTPFHDLELSSYSRFEVDKLSHEVNPTENGPCMDTEEFVTNFASPSQNKQAPLTCPCNDFRSLGVKTPNKHWLLIQCVHCHNYQHAICYGILPENKHKFTEHCCNECYCQDQNKKPTDYKYFMILQDDSTRMANLYIIRHILFLCMELHSIDVMAIINYFGVREKYGWQIFQSLLDHNYVIHDKELRISTPLIINKNQLKVGIEDYFYIDSDDDLTDRLVEESLTSSTQYDTDQFGNLLPSVEIKALAKNKIYSIVQQENRNDSNDETIKQFRDVILKDTQPISDELPLSGSHNPVQGFKDTTELKRKARGKEVEDELKKKKSRK